MITREKNFWKEKIQRFTEILQQTGYIYIVFKNNKNNVGISEDTLAK